MIKFIASAVSDLSTPLKKKKRKEK